MPNERHENLEFSAPQKMLNWGGETLSPLSLSESVLMIDAAVDLKRSFGGTLRAISKQRPVSLELQ